MILDKNYRVIYDEYNVILQYHRIRTKNKKDGTKEKYEYTKESFFPSIEMCLNSYIDKNIKHSKSIDEVLKRLDELKFKFKKYKNEI